MFLINHSTIEIVKEDSTEKLSQEASKYIDGTLCLICGVNFDSTLEHIVGKHSETVLKLSKIPGIFSPEHEKILDTEIENGQSTKKQKIPMVQIKSESFDTSGFESDNMTEKSNVSSITVADLDSGSENADIGIKDSIAKALDFDNLTDDEKKNHETSIIVIEQDIGKGQLILKCPFGVLFPKTNEIFSRISALASKKRSNQKEIRALYTTM